MIFVIVVADVAVAAIVNTCPTCLCLLEMLEIARYPVEAGETVDVTLCQVWSWFDVVDRVEQK